MERLETRIVWRDLMIYWNWCEYCMLCQQVLGFLVFLGWNFRYQLVVGAYRYFFCICPQMKCSRCRHRYNLVGMIFLSVYHQLCVDCLLLCSAITGTAMSEIVISAVHMPDLGVVRFNVMIYKCVVDQIVHWNCRYHLLVNPKVLPLTVLSWLRSCYILNCHGPKCNARKLRISIKWFFRKCHPLTDGVCCVTNVAFGEVRHNRTNSTVDVVYVR